MATATKSVQRQQSPVRVPGSYLAPHLCPPSFLSFPPSLSLSPRKEDLPGLYPLRHVPSRITPSHALPRRDAASLPALKDNLFDGAF